MRNLMLKVIVVAGLGVVIAAGCHTGTNGQGWCISWEHPDCSGSHPTVDFCDLLGIGRGGNVYACNADWTRMPYADGHRKAIATLASYPAAVEALTGLHIELGEPWPCDWLTCDTSLAGARAQALAALHETEDPLLECTFALPEIVSADFSTLAAGLVSFHSQIKGWQPPALCRKPPDTTDPADPPEKCSDFQEPCSNPNLLRAGIYPYCCSGLQCSAQDWSTGDENDPAKWYGTCCLDEHSYDDVGLICTQDSDCCQFPPHHPGDTHTAMACQGSRCCELLGSLCHRFDDHCCVGYACTGNDPGTDEDIGTCQPL